MDSKVENLLNDLFRESNRFLLKIIQIQSQINELQYSVDMDNFEDIQDSLEFMKRQMVESYNEIKFLVGVYD